MVIDSFNAQASIKTIILKAHMLPKPTRIRSKKNLQMAKDRPCCCCGDKPCDPHHIKTRGSGGGDETNNLLSLCRKHHTQIHQIGFNKMLELYPGLRAFLKA